MANKPRWLRIPTGDMEGLYQLKPWQGEIDLNRVPDCPCCEKKLSPGYDICQWGMWEDEYRSYLLCKDCKNAFELFYHVPTYAILSKKAQRASGLLLTSKEPREAGSDRRER